MAVYTPLSDQDLQHFLKRYDLGALVSFSGIADGVENSNFHVRTDQGPCILTIYEKRVHADDLPFFLKLMEHCAAKGVQCPLPLHDRNDQALQTLAGKPAALFTFLEGVWPRQVQPHHCAAAGAALARFHLAARDFPLSRANTLSLAGWTDLFEHCAARADTVRRGLAHILETELHALQRSWPQGLPTGVCHADLFPDNTFFLNETVTGLIDFYFACNDILAYDLAICLNAWCFERDHDFNATKARRFLKGYQSVRPLTPEETAALPILARGAAMRFLLTRLHDWLHQQEGALVRPKDPLEYLGRLAFHQRVSSMEAYGLGY